MRRLVATPFDLNLVPVRHTYFTLDEMYASAVARNLEIMNFPPASIQKNIHALIYAVLDPLRARWSAPIHVTSGYRCRELNTAVRGSENSAHLVGLAADIVPTNRSKEEVQKLFQLAARMMTEGQLPVAQLIDERDYSWLHISLDIPFVKGQTEKPRCQILHLP